MQIDEKEVLEQITPILKKIPGLRPSPEQERAISDRLLNVLNYEPKSGLFGKTGAGKSSLCNALFGQDICEISDIEACTRNSKEVLLKLGGKGIKLVDVPGVGESEERDNEYAKLYDSLLPELDLVLWVLKADERAYTTDSSFYHGLVKSHSEIVNLPFFFVLNQVDKIEPFREWNEQEHSPGDAQFRNIDRKKEAVARYFDIQKSKIIAVSANEKYNLTELIHETVLALPKETRISYYRGVDPGNRTGPTTEIVRNDFVDIVVKTIAAVTRIPPEIIKKGVELAKATGEAVVNAGKSVWNWLTSW
jgi:small GTP-binding protein